MQLPAWIMRMAPSDIRPMLGSAYKLSIGLEGEPANFNGYDITEVKPFVLTNAARLGAKFKGATLNGVVLTREPAFVPGEGDDLDLLVTESGTILGCRLFKKGFLEKVKDSDLAAIDPLGPSYWPSHKDSILATESAYLS